MKKKMALFAALCGMTLIGAGAPSPWNDGQQQVAGGYPPCSATVTDRCIQLYERGVATAANLALNDRLGSNNTQLAMGGPYEPIEYENEPVESYSSYEDDAATDIMAADGFGDEYAEADYAYNDYAADEPEANWSGFEDDGGY